MSDLHSFNCPGDVWADAAVKAKAEGRTVTGVIVDALRAYAGGVVPAVPEGVPERLVRPREPSGEPACKHPKARVLKGWCSLCRTGGH